MSQAAIEDGPLLLSIKRTASLLGLSEWQVRGLVEEGTLPATRVPPTGPKRRIYIPAAAVSEYVASISESA